MKIVSVTIAHNREGTIAGALASVLPHVDECLIIDTGITDYTLDVAYEACAVTRTYPWRGDKAAATPLVVHVDPWRDDFSRARNCALDLAARREADWAIMIDTDQRIDWNGVDPRKFLSNPDAWPYEARLFTMRDRLGRFAKEQIFAIPRQGAYAGRVHESFPLLLAAELPMARVWEVPKDSAARTAKLERDFSLLILDTNERPREGRPWFYLGETYRALGNVADAVEAYAQCFRVSSRLDEPAWAAYRAAQIECDRGDYDRALSWCQRGYMRSGSMVELPTFAAWVCLRQSDYDGALGWAKIALEAGPRHRDTPKTFFRDIPAYYEQPAGFAAVAAGALGMTEESRTYEQERIRLRALRILRWKESA